MTNLIDKFESVVHGVESVVTDATVTAPATEDVAAPAVASLATTVKADGVRLFDHAKVDLLEELPVLAGKLGVNTSDETNVGHAVLVVVVQLLATYGPAEIRTVLGSL